MDDALLPLEAAVLEQPEELLQAMDAQTSATSSLSVTSRDVDPTAITPPWQMGLTYPQMTALAHPDNLQAMEDRAREGKSGHRAHPYAGP